ncbi:hypothetical protein PY650_19970 [Rhizobium calliandrae]|uniref:Uncharacterized protein n=1 Tax=Rhizobium calliandrae TaxID=1312182 RepID=A0ABT7KGY4_9HYPH|nr:hypothetical protein [Rhizobium calliandrae]MDL2407896.1 hypothetical protein [Rhizobium calliandrae]
MLRTVWFFIFAFAAVTAHAQTTTSSDIANKLNAQAKRLGYHLTFRKGRCDQDVKYVCDFTAASGPYHYRLTAVSQSRSAPIDHFTLPMDKHISSVALASYATIVSLIGDVDSPVETVQPFLQEEIVGASTNGGVISDPFRGFQQTVTVVPGAGVLVSLSWQD